ncbi:MAG: PH domain-containing protein, partial [Anaerolineales bacterium]
MLFTPPKARGLALGLAGLALLIGLDALLLALLHASFPSFAAFLFLCLLLASLPALALIVYRSYGLVRARYALGRNALVVGWGGRREVIPLGMIGEARAGIDVEGPLRPRGLTWPGCVVGRASHPVLGEIEFLAATEKPGMVLVNTPGGWLALSPGDPQAFLQTLAAYQAQGAEERVAPESARPAIERWALWRDRTALALIALGGLGALLLFGYLTFIFPQLPPEFALHF